MCLVSYIPTKTGYILSSNRDESPLRDARIIEEEVINEERIIYPKDVKGGSWIIVSESHRIVCLLNGAFQNHISRPPYRHSRGIVMKSFYGFSNAVDFFEDYDLWNIEPFTMILVEGSALFEYRWDGSVKHIKQLAREQTHMWSSCTLYSDAVQKKRASLLKSLLSKTDLYDSQDVKKAHISIDEQDLYNGLYMDRDGLIQTISHTQIIKDEEKLQMIYHNLVNNKITKSSF